MNPLIQFKKRTPLVVIALALACFAISPMAQAVVPAPDGGYPGGNTAEGQGALLGLTMGTFNTAVGWLALKSNTEGPFNTAVGAGALFANLSTANTATGAGALLSTTGGGNNTANGAVALFSNTIGQSNTATGAGALFSNTTSNANTATGFQALFSNTIGNSNTGIAMTALVNNTTGNLNTAAGFRALFFNTTGADNTAIGSGALTSNTTGSSNTALGDLAGFTVTTANNVICIGAGVGGANVSDSCFIGNIRGVTTQNGDAVPVLIDSAGQLGTMSSSERFKKDIATMDKGSEAILALRPVTFHYKSDVKDFPQFGLIAEEVAKVNPALVLPDKEGKPYTVRYDAVNAMLLNEFLKEHRRVQELEATVAQQRKDSEATAVRQQKQIESLTAGLQKVSAQLELKNPAPQTVLNNH